MQYAFRGHVVVLCDENTASDGEAFAEGFRRLGLGKVIGTRTWGGEVWLSPSNFLVDRGIATAAETGVYGPDGDWLIEGHGVDPDIVVDNLPHATFDGRGRAARRGGQIPAGRDSEESDPNACGAEVSGQVVQAARRPREYESLIERSRRPLAPKPPDSSSMSRGVGRVWKSPSGVRARDVGNQSRESNADTMSFGGKHSKFDARERPVLTSDVTAYDREPS